MAAAMVCASVATEAGAQYAPDERMRQGYISGAPDNPSADWALAHGGRLYDNWWVTLRRDPPEKTHPAYPRSGKASGPQTWRCVECHGWDYRGKDGTYATGPHRTGIRGIDRMAGERPDRIAKILRDKRHRFTREMIPDDALARLARFISAGQYDLAHYVDPRTGKARGSLARGRAIYQNACANCHEFDGRAQISGEAIGLATIGAVAARNPPRALHKIRNGQPSADMPAMRVFDAAIIVDILTYLQTLPPR